jgi:hypothetical protein
MPLRAVLTHKDHAHEKFCPLAALRTHCAGERCMAWRFAWTHTNAKPGQELELDGETYGYCGLSGRPEAAEKL